MTIEEKFKKWCNGMTCQEIADICGVSRQSIAEQLAAYRKQLATGRRGHKFYLHQIKYQGIYDWFFVNERESIASFSRLVYGGDGARKHSALKSLITGEHNAFFSVNEMKKICEVVGKPFEEVFKERETND